MIRLKVFISSVQKKLEVERAALGGLLATDPFLAASAVPRLFEEYPAPLHPNKQAYLDLLRTCHVFLDDEFTFILAAQPKLIEASRVAAERLPAEPYVPDPALTENQNTALKSALKRGHISTAWCVQNLGVSRDTAWRMLDDLKERGYLEKTGIGRASRYIPGIRATDMDAHEYQAQTGRRSGANQT